MVITYHGENYFKISSGELSLLIDPLNQRSYKGATAVIFTEKKINEDADTYEGDTPTLDHAGEFEINGIHIQGWQAEGTDKKIKTVYRITCDDIVLGVFGGITKELPAEFSEHFEDVDIVFAPVGGTPYVGVPQMSKFLRQIEPGIIIPSLYTAPKALQEFFKEFDGDASSCEDKLVIKKKDIPEKEMKIQCLKSE